MLTASMSEYMCERQRHDNFNTHVYGTQVHVSVSNTCYTFLLQAHILQVLIQMKVVQCTYMYVVMVDSMLKTT